MRNTFAVALLLLACGPCFGQTTFKGLTPGQSTKADVERALGRPANSVSNTLIEYNGTADANKIYVQYDDETAAAGVLRIELFCESGSGAKDSRYGCKELYERLVPKPDSFTTSKVTDARIWRKSDAQWWQNYTLYHGSPALSSITFGRMRGGNAGLLAHRLVFTRALRECCPQKLHRYFRWSVGNESRANDNHSNFRVSHSVEDQGQRRILAQRYDFRNDVF